MVFAAREGTHFLAVVEIILEVELLFDNKIGIFREMKRRDGLLVREIDLERLLQYFVEICFQHVEVVREVLLPAPRHRGEEFTAVLH